MLHGVAQRLYMVYTALLCEMLHKAVQGYTKVSQDCTRLHMILQSLNTYCTELHMVYTEVEIRCPTWLHNGCMGLHKACTGIHKCKGCTALHWGWICYVPGLHIITLSDFTDFYLYPKMEAWMSFLDQM